MPDPELQWRPLLVGVPTPVISPKILPVLLPGKCDVLAYPHQLSTLGRRGDDWSQRLSPDLARLETILGHFTGRIVPSGPNGSWVKLDIKEPIAIDSCNAKAVQGTLSVPIWESTDPVAELTRLLQDDEDSDGNNTPVQDQTETAAATSGVTIEQDAAVWCDTAVEIHFNQDWHGLFPPDETINVVIGTGTNSKIDERYVRALKPNDPVLLIHGQRRQNLYDLILSRVHRHPSIEVHVALIRRWQEDLREAYASRVVKGEFHGLNGLLRSMQKYGSALTCELTIQFWLDGKTLCPHDPEDLRRLAEVLDLGFVRQYYRRIHKAATRLRGLHIGLSLKLNRWLEQQASGSTDLMSDEVIDQELGLTFADFSNSLLNLRVQTVRIVTGPFLRSDLGAITKR